MDMKRITVERCESCGRNHLLRITYDPSCLPTSEVLPHAVVLPVEFVCPNKSRRITVAVDFDAPIELVDAVAE
jgi:hypothetical protein